MPRTYGATWLNCDQFKPAINDVQVQAKYNIKAYRLFNTDETIVFVVQTPEKNIAKERLKQVAFSTSREWSRNTSGVFLAQSELIYHHCLLICKKRINEQFLKEDL